ncbi:pilus assembly protein TadE [Vibrio sp. UCD-FRSSP16_10]|uniref:TadE/TadG family type IV pilus assembly protein n=1 Tax=unclassified Vibrio TaxID=2614977 RepID=UPI000801E7A1|nr:MULTISPECIES: TadE family protein [unclassified Vibrio]OBT13867.1 pilus assembly protein TadE [Vibrio sp. UCD-FRSSP16_30]OBT22748.1 pilus assembly protein TadE [Vibrio sp. UCD-FRSSP16_10]
MDLKHLHIFKAKQKGVALVEFAVVFSLFLLIIFTIIDFALFGYVKLTMQHAVREGARYAVTGRTDMDLSDDPIREQAVLEKISQSSSGILEKVMNIDDIRVEDIDGNALSGFGDPGQLVSIHLDCEWPVLSPLILPLVEDGTYKFTVSSAMKNEEFEDSI